jgi:hypothetical protein
VNGPLTEIDDEDCLLRRVANRPDLVKRDGGVVRPSSVAFRPAGEDDKISVEVRRLLENPSDPLSTLADYPDHGLVEFRAGVPRGLGLDVEHDPLPGNNAHGNIVGLSGLARPERKRLFRELALHAVWVRQPAVALDVAS